MEDAAFYESGLSAHGCLEKLDNYTISAISKYGRLLLDMQEDQIISGFKGCCYACEPVGMLNKDLSKVIDCFYNILKKISLNAEFASIRADIDGALKLYEDKINNE